MPPSQAVWLKGIIQATEPADIEDFQLWINPSTGDIKLRNASDNAFVAVGGSGAPSAHATSHQDGGSDEIDVTGLVGAGGAAVPMTSGEFVTSGLVLAYKFNEGSGQVLTDFSPSALNGRLGSTSGADTNDPTWVAPRGLSFDGVDNYVEIGTPNAALRLTTAFSIEAKFKYDSGQCGIFDKTGAGATNENYALIAETTIKFRLVKGDGVNDLVGPTTTVNGTYHVVATYDGVEAALWVDGAKFITRKLLASPIDNVDGIALIGMLGSSAFPFLGTIYKLAVYNKALSAAEVQAAFQAS